ncbi:MAG: hypothetical protein M1828_003699 [Chrysothrix sp. TS-e1954]|nr:MAG: hypothetical protein M1828_003699 [Chrysothrix sp. TS-e1954]
MPPKRKATGQPTSSPPAKRRSVSPSNDLNGSTSLAANNNNDEDDNAEPEPSFVDRKFYPSEITNARCAQYNTGELQNPFNTLTSTLQRTRPARRATPPGKAIIHWFKRDLRLDDNRSLHAASVKAREAGVPLLGLYVVSPQDFKAHVTSNARVDFIFRSLEALREELGELDIPLILTTIEKRRNIPAYIIDLCEELEAKHVYCSIEYEVDELRREESLVNSCLEQGVAFEALDDDVVVPPGSLKTGQGRQFSVYSPWRRAWVDHIGRHPELLELSPTPQANSPSARATYEKNFDAPLPSIPTDHALTPEDHERLTSLWPAGSSAAHSRLSKFLTEKLSTYSEARSIPSSNATSMLSAHFASGTLSVRTAVSHARARAPNRKLDTSRSGVNGYISELAWRDFYKHVLCAWPYVCMHKAFKYEYSSIDWSYSFAHFTAWRAGKTGYPIVDAAMRQLNSQAYMHNRCRMIAASFLAKDLLLDWRLGERHFMSRLIDGDFASNNGGWGFSASTGVDPQPFFRIFNPVLQSERFDPQGEYIRRWVPELGEVRGAAIHDPWGRGAEAVARRVGYPRRIVEHNEARARALERYKAGLGRSTANEEGRTVIER